MAAAADTSTPAAAAPSHCSSLKAFGEVHTQVKSLDADELNVTIREINSVVDALASVTPDARRLLACVVKEAPEPTLLSRKALTLGARELERRLGLRFLEIVSLAQELERYDLGRLLEGGEDYDQPPSISASRNPAGAAWDVWLDLRTYAAATSGVSLDRLIVGLHFDLLDEVLA